MRDGFFARPAVAFLCLISAPKKHKINIYLNFIQIQINMNKSRVFIVHGWGGYPQEAWFPYLKKELEEMGLEVKVLEMPDSDNPTIDKWVSFLAKQIGTPNSDTYLIGHSIGVQTILRYLASINTPIGGVVAVAPWYKLILDSGEDKEIARPWLETPIDNEQVRRNIGKITAIFSDNDPYVGPENIDLFKNNLGAKIIILKNMGHMGGDEGITEIPEILQEVKEMITYKK